jgi:hypothetical protein
VDPPALTGLVGPALELDPDRAGEREVEALEAPSESVATRVISLAPGVAYVCVTVFSPLPARVTDVVAVSGAFESATTQN